VHIKAIENSVEFAINQMKRAMIFGSRIELWNYVIDEISQLKGEVNVLEFGVWKGESINYFAKKLPKARIIGFDSFEGLQEDWEGYIPVKGTFGLGGITPAVLENVVLIKGWFEHTLPPFLHTFKSQISILHIDCDTYTPTQLILESLQNSLQSGSIIVFDEYFGYPGWENHEHRAWTEFVQKKGVHFEYIAYSNLSCAVRIIDFD
jgi:predicted O-methyltransferase YrrM